MHPPAQQVGDIDDASVMLVGRIELLPALRPEERDLSLSGRGGWDPLGVKKLIQNRAILYLCDRPDIPREPTRSISNPPLEELFLSRVAEFSPVVVVQISLPG